MIFNSKVNLWAVLLTVAALLAAPGADAAGKRGWVLLGERTVTDRVDHDVIAVTAARGEFRKIKLSVERRAVEFHRVVVHYGNGDDQVVELRRVIPAGGESRAIDLEGRDRVIRSVELRYDAQSLAGKTATVRLFGRR
jgi:hypothetical protein